MWFFLFQFPKINKYIKKPTYSFITTNLLWGHHQEPADTINTSGYGSSHFVPLKPIKETGDRLRSHIEVSFWKILENFNLRIERLESSKLCYSITKNLNAGSTFSSGWSCDHLDLIFFFLIIYKFYDLLILKRYLWPP